jgi:hypothetical protein
MLCDYMLGLYSTNLNRSSNFHFFVVCVVENVFLSGRDRSPTAVNVVCLLIQESCSYCKSITNILFITDWSTHFRDLTSHSANRQCSQLQKLQSERTQISVALTVKTTTLSNQNWKHKELRTEFFGEYVLQFAAGILFTTGWAFLGSNLSEARISIPVQPFVKLVPAVFPVT